MSAKDLIAGAVLVTTAVSAVVLLTLAKRPMPPAALGTHSSALESREARPLVVGPGGASYLQAPAESEASGECSARIVLHQRLLDAPDRESAGDLASVLEPVVSRWIAGRIATAESQVELLPALRGVRLTIRIADAGLAGSVVADFGDQRSLELRAVLSMEAAGDRVAVSLVSLQAEVSEALSEHLRAGGDDSRGAVEPLQRRGCLFGGFGDCFVAGVVAPDPEAVLEESLRELGKQLRRHLESELLPQIEEALRLPVLTVGAERLAFELCGPLRFEADRRVELALQIAARPTGSSDAAEGAERPERVGAQGSATDERRLARHLHESDVAARTNRAVDERVEAQGAANDAPRAAGHLADEGVAARSPGALDDSGRSIEIDLSPALLNRLLVALWNAAGASPRSSAGATGALVVEEALRAAVEAESGARLQSARLALPPMVHVPPGDGRNRRAVLQFGELRLALQMPAQPPPARWWEILRRREPAPPALVHAVAHGRLAVRSLSLEQQVLRARFELEELDVGCLGAPSAADGFERREPCPDDVNASVRTGLQKLLEPTSQLPGLEKQLGNRVVAALSGLSLAEGDWPRLNLQVAFKQ